MKQHVKSFDKRMENASSTFAISFRYF